MSNAFDGGVGRSRTSTQCLYLEWTMCFGLSGENTFTFAVTKLACETASTTTEYSNRQIRVVAVGLDCEKAEAVSNAGSADNEYIVLDWRIEGIFSAHAAGRWLDPGERFAGAARVDLSGPLAKASAGTEMISSREKILGKIRQSLHRETDHVVDAEALKARMTTRARHPLPAFNDALPLRFQQKIEAACATVAKISSLSEVAGEVHRYLDEVKIAKEIIVSSDEFIEQIEWSGNTMKVEKRLPTGTDAVSVTSAFCAIAETGTLMLLSGERSATSLNFLPDYHIVVMSRELIVPYMEDAWDCLRDKFGAMPRAVNFISGPSKTADVEQTVEYGAHGPRCLHVILVG